MHCEGYCSCRVCLSSHFTSHQSLHKQYQVFSVRYIKVEKYVGFSLKLLRLRVMVWNTSEKANIYIIRIGLPRAGPLALCILKAQEVTTKGVYQLRHAIYYCSWPVSDELLPGDHK